MNVLKLVAVPILLCVCAFAHGEVVGPIPYSGPGDSPFNPTGPGSSFFVEDFSAPPAVFYRPLPPYGYNHPFASISTPGVEIDGLITWDGSHLGTVGSCTDSIPPSCLAITGFQFDANRLGSLPRAVGFAVGGSGTLELSVYDVQDQLVETTSVNLDQYQNPSIPPLDGFFVLPPPNFVFVGATEPEGISRIVLISNSSSVAIDDFQYGQFVPEPAAQSLVIVALALVALWRFRSHRTSISTKPAALVHPCTAGG